MKQLTNQLKEQYKKELEYNPKKDFYSEFDRTSELQMEIINTYGFEGLQLVLKNENIINLGSFPADCPWHSINNYDIPKAIDATFSIEGKTIESGFIDEIKNRCFNIFTEKTKDGWQLSYVISFKLYTEKSLYSVITGGTPQTTDALQKIFKKLNWEMPDELNEFYSIHNGLFKDGETIVTPAERLQNLKKTYPDLEELTELKPEDVLRIADDGAGNLIGYVRHHEYLDVIDIDHETLEINNMYGLFGYLDSRFEQLDETDEDEDFDDENEDDSDESFSNDNEDFGDNDAPYTKIKFSKKYSITSSTILSTEVIKKYKDIAPPALIHLWETQGLPHLNNGIVTFINPDDYIATLDLWLGKHKDNYIPFAVGAFGNLFYYRRLTQDEEDVCVIDPHFRDIDTCEWSFREFFEMYLNDEFASKYVLREKQFTKAFKKNGELAANEMYIFTPALALGGDENGNKTEKGNIQVHLQFLFEITQ